MELEYIRDYAMYTAIFGVMSSVWFGWAQENPRNSWKKYLTTASIAGVLLGLSGFYLGGMNWDAASAMNESGSYVIYIIVFYAEMIIAVIGVIILYRKKKKEYVAPWISLIVGVHFIFLVDVFNDSALYILAVLMTAGALISPWLARKLEVAYSAVAGISSGSLLFIFAIIGLIRFLLAS